MADVRWDILANLGQNFLGSYDAGRKRYTEDDRVARLQALGARYPDQLPPASVMGATLLQGGDLAGAMTAARLAQTQADREWQRELGTANLGLKAAHLEQTKSDRDWTRQLGAANYGLKAAQADPAVIAAQAKAKQVTLPSAVQDKILKAEDEAAAARQTMGHLQQALDLNEKTFSGAGALAQGKVAGSIPEWVPNVAPFPDRQKGIDTQTLDNLLQKQVLSNLKATFGSQMTLKEGEILRDVEGSVNKPADVRRGILQRASETVRERLGRNERRAQEMRSGTYFEPGEGGAPAVAATSPKYEEGKRYRSKSTGAVFVIRNGKPVAE